MLCVETHHASLAPNGLSSLTPGPCGPARCARQKAGVGWGLGGIAAPFTVSRGSRRRGRRAPCALASWRPSATPNCLRCAVLPTVPGNPACQPEHAHFATFFHFVGCLAAGARCRGALPAGDGQQDSGRCAPAHRPQDAARASFSSQAVVKEYLRAKLAGLGCEVFTVPFLGTQHRTDQIRRDVPRHHRQRIGASGRGGQAGATAQRGGDHHFAQQSERESRAERGRQGTAVAAQERALALVDLRPLVHIVVAGSATTSCAERGLLRPPFRCVWCNSDPVGLRAALARTCGEAMDIVTLILHMLEVFIAGIRGFHRR